MDSSDDLERRLQRELKEKLRFLEHAPARPSEAMVQQRLKESGNKCFEATEIIEKAQREFVNLMTSQDEFLKARGGALHFYVKLKTLHYEHQQHRSDIVRNVENFVMAHEWYELLVAAHEADELARLGFLDELNREIFYESTQPGHPKYPEILEIHRNYERSNVSRMVRFQLIQIDALLEEERSAKEEAKSHSKLTRRLEDEVLTDLRLAMENLQLEVREEIQEVKRRMENLENAYKEHTNYILENLNDKNERILHNIEELHERFNEMSLEDTPRNRNRPLLTQQPTNNPRNARAGSNRKQPDEDPEELKHEYEKKLRQCEEELHEVDRYLNENIMRERHYGDRRMKDSEYHLMCVYCLERGRHYSDACSKYRTVEERTDVLIDEDRCRACLQQHEGEKCKKKVKCFYCNYGKPESQHEYSDHHASICPKPEQFTNAQQHRIRIKEEYDHYRQLLTELETRRCLPSSSSTTGRETVRGGRQFDSMAPGPSRNI